MYQFIEKGIRRGVTERYGKVNNNYIKFHAKYIIYERANHFEWWARSQCLPVGGFKWLRKYEIDAFEGDNVQADSS